MSAAERLLWLYPRAWRARYGEEFLATVDHHPLSTQQVIDIVAGAIDAWLSADVQRVTGAISTVKDEGELMTLKSQLVCQRGQSRYSTRDGLIGAGVMLAATLTLIALGAATRRAGWPAAGELFISLAFPGSLVLSMPFWLLKGQPWRAQVVMVGATLALLVVAGSVASLI